MNTELTKDNLRKIYGKVSPFEFKDKLLQLASLSNNIILDAGRGNPNWTAATPRQAFFTFGQFAILETQRSLNIDGLAGMVQKNGIAKRLLSFINDNPSLPGINLISKIYDYGVNTLGFNEDEWIFELADGIIGDNYPVPDRMLINIEKVVNKYLIKELCGDTKFKSNFDVFGVEGGTAAMCYIFDSLEKNHLLNRGDKIALMTPIFTPYLEIPHLPHYDFDVINIHANEVDENGIPTYQYTEEDLNKLKDTSIKAVFIVNPNNPASIALNDKCRETLKDIVNNYNPNLMIITDDVYCTFVDNFKSVISDLPYNTIGVYSLSKYFGVTGWRLGAIILNEDNIYNKLISELPEIHKANLNLRYCHLSCNPEKISFIDRIVADSRQVALNHTAGLSTPQQVQMAFFCAFALIDSDDNYKNLTKSICQKRKQLLCHGLNVEIFNDPHYASYYTEINILDWARVEYGIEASEYIENNYTPFDILYSLAKNYSTVLLNGDGFASSRWGLRVSLANLNSEAYFKIGQTLRSIFNDIMNDFKSSSNLEVIS
ncbi:aspartate 4-decarboxylase [Clostridium sp. D43t1_170807_H7]|uniref:aspartate 4-decarboxylase n=1 Tax=Clostridium sp. D43t1_170807_H7 TaxID=2787140 RepID=UPI00189A21A2|nr:aspartate 4-decarboxylase [Clostridium sp. D43t1_170807_H7]